MANSRVIILDKKWPYLSKSILLLGNLMSIFFAHENMGLLFLCISFTFILGTLLDINTAIRKNPDSSEIEVGISFYGIFIKQKSIKCRLPEGLVIRLKTNRFYSIGFSDSSDFIELFTHPNYNPTLDRFQTLTIQMLTRWN